MVINIVGYDIIIDEDDYKMISKYRWHIKHNAVSMGLYYFHTYIKNAQTGKRELHALHRMIMQCSPGDGTIIDHIDRNTLNNSKGNLRFATPSDNSRNRTYKRKNSTGYMGVYRKSKNYTCTIRYNNKNRNVGGFTDVIECAKMYDKLSIKIAGEFAVTNFDRNSYTQEEIDEAFRIMNDPLRVTNTSGYFGVSYADNCKYNKWRSYICVDSKTYYIGFYATPEEAARAYDKKALELGRGIDKLNYPMYNKGN